MSRLATHYESVRKRFGYDAVDDTVAPPWLQPLRRRFVAADDAVVLESALDRPTLVCMGVGMTGSPHLGTVGQLLTAIELQEAGLDVQFVLADLEPYHDGANAERIGRLAERYREFALDLGFDPDRGVLRTQSEAYDVMATGHRLARYYQPADWQGADDEASETAWEEAVESLYASEDGKSGNGESRSAGPTSDAAAAHSSVLHGADFLHPLCERGHEEGSVGEYEQILLAFGIDEHGLASWTRQFRDAAGVSGRIGGLYTRMVPGFDGVPKQSKSIGAGVSLDADPGIVHEQIASAPDANEPERSTVFEAMCFASRYDVDRLDAFEAACESGGAEWDDARRAFAESVAGLAERWHATADGDE
ncbi:hypothetical protein GCM10028857_24640 [Salinarchaeum chitinilyticum]